MLDKVKLALRLSGTALDGEVSDLINAAIADLRLVGINIPAEAGSSSKTLGDPLLDRAVVLYAKAEFGFLILSKIFAAGTGSKSWYGVQARTTA